MSAKLEKSKAKQDVFDSSSDSSEDENPHKLTFKQISDRLEKLETLCAIVKHIDNLIYEIHEVLISGDE